jgi:endoglucanase
MNWNNSNPENSWEITEPAIYYQASYIKLLSKFID